MARVTPLPGHASGGDESRLKFGRFTCAISQRLGIPRTEYLYSDKEKFSQHDIELMLDVWDLTRPNLIISLMGPWKPNPDCFVVPDMFMQPALAGIVEEAQSSMKLAFGLGDGTMTSTETSGSVGHMVAKDPILHKTLGCALRQKLVSSIVAVLNACYLTNSWIVLEHSPSALWPILEEALGKIPTKPIVINIDHSGEDAADYYHKDEVQKSAWEDLRERAQPLVSGDDVEKIATINLPDKLWDEKSLMADAFEDIRYENYSRFPGRSSTHSIFARSWDPINWKALAPKGTMYAVGGPKCASVMMENLLKHEPSIFLLHTGGAADFFAHAIDIVLHEGLTKVNEVLQRMTDRYPFWVAEEQGRTCLYAGVETDKAYLVVKSILDCYFRSPDAFRSTTVVLNMWTVTPHEVLERLSNCFAASSSVSALHDIGAQDAKEQSILLAWGLYDTLEYNCRKFANITNTLTVSGTLLSLLTTALSVFVIFVECREPTSWGSASMAMRVWRYHKQALLLLPALAGLMMTALSRLQYINKWGSMHLAKVQIESEIWQFRVDAGVTYGQHQAPSSNKKLKEEKGKKTDDDRESTPQDSRYRFTQRTTTLFNNVLKGEMAQDAFGVRVGNGSKARAEETLRKRREGQEAIPDDSIIAPLLKKNDDFLQSLTGEAYFELRVRPQMARLSSSGPTLSRRLLIFEVLLLVTTLTSTLLAAMQYKEWIPLAVAFSSTLSSFANYQALHGRLAAVNAAIADLTILEGTWASLGVVEKRTDSIKNMMVKITEGAILREASAFVAGAAQLPTLNKIENAKEDKSKKAD